MNIKYDKNKRLGGENQEGGEIMEYFDWSRAASL